MQTHTILFVPKLRGTQSFATPVAVYVSWIYFDICAHFNREIFFLILLIFWFLTIDWNHAGGKRKGRNILRNDIVKLIEYLLLFVAADRITTNNAAFHIIFRFLKQITRNNFRIWGVSRFIIESILGNGCVNRLGKK